jgi:hypothetical protein
LVFPKSASTSEKERFAAGSFLTINSNQTKAKTTLRQDIEVVLNPSSTTAIARQVMDRLAKSSPLSGHVEMYSFEKGKLKTSSIVSFGLAPLIKLQGNDSLFSIFKHPDKEALAAGKSVSALSDYLKFAATRINIFLNAVKANTDELRWTADPKVKKRLLTVTYINSFLITLRHLISTQEKTDYGALKAALADINHFPFQTYKSSQYNRMADEIFKKYFS